MTALWPIIKPLLWKWLGGWLIDRIRRKIDPGRSVHEKLREQIRELENQADAKLTKINALILGDFDPDPYGQLDDQLQGIERKIRGLREQLAERKRDNGA